MEDLTNLVPSALSGAAGQSPVILLMLVLIKEIRAWKAQTTQTVTADANQAAKITILEAFLQRSEQDHKATRDRLALIESQQQAVWRRIGTRPGDRNNHGDDT